jgi:hypothetical protein
MAIIRTGKTRHQLVTKTARFYGISGLNSDGCREGRSDNLTKAHLTKTPGIIIVLWALGLVLSIAGPIAAHCRGHVIEPAQYAAIAL